MRYTKNEAIQIAKNFLEEIKKIEKEYNMFFNSDTGDIYLSFETKKESSNWVTISIVWIGDGTGLIVTESIKDQEYYRKKALKKLSRKEKESLGL